VQDALRPWFGTAPVRFILQGQEDRLAPRKQTVERVSRFCAGFLRQQREGDYQGNYVLQLLEEANEEVVQLAEKEREQQRRVRNGSLSKHVPSLGPIDYVTSDVVCVT
jgi:hypothetical protein